MRRTGTANLPLHGGHTPRWLFQRMVKLSYAIAEAIVVFHGKDEFLSRIADPFWFQSFGCILGFDWHSSGLTTTVMGALKQAMRNASGELGIMIAGGKGATSRRTPIELKNYAEQIGFEPAPLIYASKMSAKVDTAAIQDGYQIYHHNIIFTADCKWAVVQQGMNDAIGFARRYHWLSDGIRSFVEEPHSGIASQHIAETVLDMTAKKSASARERSVELSRENPQSLLREVNRVKKIFDSAPSLFSEFERASLPSVERMLQLPRRHHIVLSDISPNRLEQTLLRIYELKPESYESLLGISGVGPATVRAFALLSELLFGDAPSFADPARFSFAHGGKDGYPYPVNRARYDETINFLRNAITKAKLSAQDRDKLLKKLSGIAV